MFNRLKTKTVVNQSTVELLRSIKSKGGSPEYSLKELDRKLTIRNHISNKIISCISCYCQSECMLKCSIDSLVQLPGELSKDLIPLFGDELYVQAALKCIEFEPINDPLFNK